MWLKIKIFEEYLSFCCYKYKSFGMFIKTLKKSFTH